MYGMKHRYADVIDFFWESAILGKLKKSQCKLISTIEAKSSYKSLCMRCFTIELIAYVFRENQISSFLGCKLKTRFRFTPHQLKPRSFLALFKLRWTICEGCARKSNTFTNHVTQKAQTKRYTHAQNIVITYSRIQLSMPYHSGDEENWDGEQSRTWKGNRRCGISQFHIAVYQDYITREKIVIRDVETKALFTLCH